MAAASEEARRTLRYVESLSDARTPLADFFSILLGFRYSIVTRGTDGQEREVDTTTTLKSRPSGVLTVEANQEAYLQVWKTVGSSPP
ncbi:MAG: hypothetical protein ABI604_15795 [Nitrospirota bacterium]